MELHFIKGKESRFVLGCFWMEKNEGQVNMDIESDGRFVHGWDWLGLD